MFNIMITHYSLLVKFVFVIVQEKPLVATFGVGNYIFCAIETSPFCLHLHRIVNTKRQYAVLRYIYTIQKCISMVETSKRIETSFMGNDNLIRNCLFQFRNTFIYNYSLFFICNDWKALVFFCVHTC